MSDHNTKVVYRNAMRALRRYRDELVVGIERLEAFDQEIELGDAGPKEHARLARACEDLQLALRRATEPDIHLIALAVMATKRTKEQTDGRT